MPNGTYGGVRGKGAKAKTLAPRPTRLTIEEILAQNEGQSFDRKRVKIAQKDLAEIVVAMANADGGTIAIGITDGKRLVEGVDQFANKLNELLCVPFDFCNPSVPVDWSMCRVLISRAMTIMCC